MDVFRHRTKAEAALHVAMADLREALYWFNLGQGVLFVVAMIFLASYMGVDFVEEADVSKLADRSTVVQRNVITSDAVPAKGVVPATKTLERAIPATGYVPATANSSSTHQQTQDATPQAGTAGSATPAIQQSSAGGSSTPLKN